MRCRRTDRHTGGIATSGIRQHRLSSRSDVSQRVVQPKAIMIVKYHAEVDKLGRPPRRAMSSYCTYIARYLRAARKTLADLHKQSGPSWFRTSDLSRVRRALSR